VPLLRRRSAAARRRIRRLRLFAVLLVLGLLASASFTLGLVAAVASEIPSLDPEKQQARELNGVIYANDGQSILAVLRGAESRVLVDSDEISARMKQAIVAIEDRRFWDHNGVDLRGILRALWADVREKRVVEGGSTITQQYVKNAYIDNKRSFGRKVREAALARQLDQDWSKEKILTEYLNTIYFGNGAYGIQQAARVYFGKSALDLNLAESALLAGIPADPTGFDPVTRPGAARVRRAHVLAAMLEVGNITPREFRNARRAPLPRPEEVGLPGTETTWRAPYFTNYVKAQLIERFGARRVFGGGLQVKTTIDLGLQERARDAIEKWLPGPDAPDAALVAVDPKTGNVLAMVGGRNYRESQFNLAVQSERQPGSSFKPFVLATALQQGISPATTFVSKPLTVFLGDRYVSISNYEHAYLGSTDVRTATIHSDNSVYTQLTQLVGPKRVAATAAKLGVTSKLNGYLSIGLGGEAVNPLELARAYEAFANGGYRIDVTAPRRALQNRPRVVEEVRAANGDVVDTYHQLSHEVLSPRTAAIVNDLLRQVIERGTGRRAALRGWTTAGKTGTTENYGDAWFVGYTPPSGQHGLVVAVWVGYKATLRPMLTEFHGDPVAGGTYPALIWKSFMERALPYLGLAPEAFPAPGYDAVSPQLVVERDGRVQRDNGVCRETHVVLYFFGYEPKRIADCKPNEVDVPAVVGMTLAEARDRLALQPLRFTIVYKPAKPLQPTNVVLGQIPRRGHLSSYDEVTLVLAKAMHGTVPNVEGATLAQARRKLDRRKLRGEVTRFSEGPPGRVVSQSPRPGLAAAPGMTVKLVVARARSPAGAD
jgi:penicillin-binding protein 1A